MATITYEKTVATPSAEVIKLRKWWDKCHALMEGTDAMRDMREAYLPKWPSETDETYERRLAGSTLFPAFSRTVKTLAAKPFSKPVIIDEATPEDIKMWLQDADLQGRNIDTVAAEQMALLLQFGFVGILAEYQRRPASVVTKADEKAAGLRPYSVTINPRSILGWKTKTDGGKTVLTQLRILECVEEDDGEYGTKDVEQVRLFAPGVWEIHRKDARGKWFKAEEGVTSLDYIPFVAIYAERKSFMVSKPPLLELANLNIKHWQSESDQFNLLHVARVPILVATGVDQTFSLVVGSSAAVKLPLNATLTYTEHTGAALDAGAKSLEVLKEEMRQSGAELLVLKPGPVTATEVASDNAIGMCALQEISAGLEDGWDQVLQMFSDYSANELTKADGGHVQFFSDFGAATLAEASASLLIGMANAGKLSNKTLIEELKRRGILSAEVEYEDEVEQMATEGPAPGEEEPDDAAVVAAAPNGGKVNGDPEDVY
jgi:hypothetical protein